MMKPSEKFSVRIIKLYIYLNWEKNPYYFILNGQQKKRSNL